MSERQKQIGIYKITSPSGKVYIGRSIDIRARVWKYSAGRCSNQPKLYNSILKHGWESHLFEVIHTCEKAELNYWEKYFIGLYKTFNTDIGLNLTMGGDGTTGRILSQETKSLIGKAHIGKIVSDETRLKSSIALKGIPAWNKGLPTPKIIKAKISKSLIGRVSPCGMRGKKWTEQTRAKFISSSTGVSRNKGNIAYQYPVVQMTHSGDFIKNWDSAKQASRQLKLNQSLICLCCKGRRNKTGGYKWKYKD